MRCYRVRGLLTTLLTCFCLATPIACSDDKAAPIGENQRSKAKPNVSAGDGTVPYRPMEADLSELDAGLSNYNDGPRDAAPPALPPEAAANEPIVAADKVFVDAAVEPPKPLPGDAVFFDGQVLKIAVNMKEEAWKRLEEFGNEEVYLPGAASIRGQGFDEQHYAEIGFRHKGAWSLHHCWDENDGVRSHEDECAKLSYKIKFSEYDKEARFQGLKKLNLHASSGDPTKLRELLAYSTFRAFDVDAPRAVPAELTINGQSQGLFIAVEMVDGRYTASRFPESGDGNLYKEVWPRAGLPDEHFLAALETNEEDADVSDMQAFAAAVEAAEPGTLEGDLQQWVDVDALLRYIAVDRALKNWDGIMSFYSPKKPHNYYWYHDDAPGGRFHLIPWDLDNTFLDVDPYTSAPETPFGGPVPNWNVAPNSCKARSVWDPGSGLTIVPPRCDKLLDLLAQTQWDRFAVLGKDLLKGPLSPDVMGTKVAAWSATLKPMIAADPHLEVTEWESHVGQFAETLKKSVVDFDGWLVEGLMSEPEVSGPPPPSGEKPDFTAAQLNMATRDSGINVFGLTNFEFGGTNGSAPVGVFTYKDNAATLGASWNSTAPISGAGDLRFDFKFVKQPGTYDEWVNLGINTTGKLEVDLTAYTAVTMTLRADGPRKVRVRLVSPAFEEDFGDVWNEFGQDVQLGTEPKTIDVMLRDVKYASWARSAWTPGQGWTSTDDEALEIVLRRFTGLLFNPSATWDPNGELLTPSEVGSLQIDNIYFW